MNAKEKYTPEEWQVLEETLALSSMLIMLASPQGAAGFVRESSAMYTALTRMLNHGAAYPLIDALRLDMRDKPMMRPAGASSWEENPDQLRKHILDNCRQITQLFNQKAEPDEAAYYKQGLLWVCGQVASAVHEGGVFGGSDPGQKISPDEHQSLRQIAFALGISASDMLVAELPNAPRRSLPTQLTGIYSELEWEILRQAPIWISAAITAASPSGFVGVLREISALVRSLSEARQRFPDNHLIDALVDDLGILANVGGRPAIIPDGPVSAQQAFDQAVRMSGQAADLLRIKVNLREGEEYKTMLLDMARQVAESAREGGFFGIGSKKISSEEQSVLDAVAHALNAGG